MLQWPNLDGCYATVPTIRDTDPVDTSGDGQNWSDVLVQSSPVVTDSVVRRAGRHTGLDHFSIVFKIIVLFNIIFISLFLDIERNNYLDEDIKSYVF